ncbi:MAG: helix-turn-helix domain-containing protein [Cellulosilyticaceae bacterium]
MTNLNEYLMEQMECKEFKEAFEEIGPEYEIIRAVIDGRSALNLTQKELSDKTGIQQSHISRLENGNYNPSIKFLKRIAEALGKELHIEFR